MQKLNIGILTGGGDCAGLNPAIKWVVKTAMDQRLVAERGMKYEVLGIRNGWRGLMFEDGPGQIEENVMPLNEDIVRTWDRYGGTYLGTSRSNPYNPQNDKSAQVIENINKLGLHALVAIGGDDTLWVAKKLAENAGINVVGIPKTIDKDLCGTDYTLGFETSVSVIMEEIDRLRTTAGSHRRIFVVETMGRHAGWLALEGGEASGAYIILIPECDFSVDKVCKLITEGRQAGARYEIIVVAEGAKPEHSAEFVRNAGVDDFGHKMLGGIGEFLARQIATITKLETRSVVLSHLQRGGAPCAFDRRMGRYFGIAAVDLIVSGDFGRMVCYRNGEISSCPLEDAIGKMKLVDINNQYDIERYNGRRTILRHLAKGVQ
jgi:phosphofructokinase-like protein